jgi:hypothetical protein
MLTRSGDIQGLRALGLDSAKLGSVRELFIDLAAGRIEFLVIEGASLLGGSGKLHPVPWAAVRYDGPAQTFHIDITKEAFKSSPSYDRDQLASSSYAWDEQANRFFTSARH